MTHDVAMKDHRSPSLSVSSSGPSTLQHLKEIASPTPRRFAELTRDGAEAEADCLYALCLSRFRSRLCFFRSDNVHRERA